MVTSRRDYGIAWLTSVRHSWLTRSNYSRRLRWFGSIGCLAWSSSQLVRAASTASARHALSINTNQWICWRLSTFNINTCPDWFINKTYLINMVARLATARAKNHYVLGLFFFHLFIFRRRFSDAVQVAFSKLSVPFAVNRPWCPLKYMSGKTPIFRHFLVPFWSNGATVPKRDDIKNLKPTLLQH